MKAERLSTLPDWPARMTADVACLYMGQSQSSFLARYRQHGRKEGSNVYWSRAQLDRLIANQFGMSQPLALAREEDRSWDDLL
ncbi:hypothetical protein [Sphingomonas baiyangensis]|uniref:Uncharacterized protein n=1 Tax=Sphingomonas baiyangensis TaxID=2572576 RepID=A0A4U1L179_9SPHN|nr:hypothetical protein [Sphingomonas baiyangensis]TKD50539.1 hypothetical protein FBR43_07020 [Sphingomonas baiyangensis]